MVRTREVSTKHTQWSTRYDDRELIHYFHQLGKQIPRQVDFILDMMAEEAIAKVVIRLLKAYPDPAIWEEQSQPRSSMGEVVLDSLKHRRSRTERDNESRLSIFSDPFPMGAKGSRGGRIAQYLQEGVAPFYAISNGKYFRHRGFPALDYMGEMARFIRDTFKDVAERKLESNLRPGGKGARR